MSNIKKLMVSAAGGAGLNVEEVFSTYLYTGNSSSQSISNGIDLSTEGGMVWVKSRTANRGHFLADTERGSSKTLNAERTDAETTDTTRFTSFNTDGFSVGGSSNVNNSSEDYASWTFRKAPKFFDVVTYTGDGTDARTVSHNLGVVPGMIVVKRRDSNSSGSWWVYHRSLDVNGDNAPETDFIYLNQNAAASDSNQLWDDTAPTATEFTLHGNPAVNGSGASYVAYLFAHNNGDGGFGPDGDADIIKCGSYTGNGSTNGTEVDLGFEPQWIMIKRTDVGGAGYDWFMFDAMRGMPVGGADVYVDANSTDAETGSSERFKITPTGFKLASTSGSFNDSGGTYIYMAIRRGPMAVPEDATDVFDIQYSTIPYSPTSPGFPVDFAIADSSTKYVFDRMRGKKALVTNNNDAEFTFSAVRFDYQDGFSFGGDLSYFRIFQWRRAPNYFDVVCYTGDGTTSQTINHNLGVEPEMIWIKTRDNAPLNDNWLVYHKDRSANQKGLLLNETDAEQNLASISGTPTDTQMVVENAYTSNASGNYIAYLFATVPGVSKVGSFTSDGTDMTIDCGFTNSARFVLLKRTNTSDDWFVFRDIVAGNDKRLKLNNTTAEATGSDNIDPDSSGFIINNNILGGSGNSFIFYAIA